MNDPVIAPEPKKVFQSKTAIANAIVVLAGALANSQPEVQQFVSQNSGTILVVIGVGNILLRLITRGRWVLY